MEDYAAKMALKPEADLRQYVTGYAQYREDAVLAALAELRRRGTPAPEEEALRPQLEQAVQQQQAAEQATRASEVATKVPDADAPALYTPGAIVLFSVLFNTILTGAILLAINLRRLKQTQAIWRLVGFVVAYLFAEAVLVNLFMQQYALNPLVLSLLNLPAIMVYIFWFWPRYVGTSQFQPRSWLIPLLICFVVMMALGLLARYILPYIPGGEQMLKQVEQKR
jgi:hypothetical protein